MADLTALRQVKTFPFLLFCYPEPDGAVDDPYDHVSDNECVAGRHGDNQRLDAELSGIAEQQTVVARNVDDLLGEDPGQRAPTNPPMP